MLMAKKTWPDSTLAHGVKEDFLFITFLKQ